jgi:hypothetical protein
MILAPSDERAKGMCVIVRNDSSSAGRSSQTEDARGGRSTPISVVCRVYDLCIRISILMQACTIENSPVRAATNSEAVSPLYAGGRPSKARL